MVTAVKWWVKRKGKWGYDWHQQWEEWGSNRLKHAKTC
jgi:hypothetical protein